jgi:hypothetical protein
VAAIIGRNTVFVHNSPAVGQVALAHIVTCLSLLIYTIGCKYKVNHAGGQQTIKNKKKKRLVLIEIILIVR